MIRSSLYDINDVLEIFNAQGYQLSRDLEHEMAEIQTYGGSGIDVETLRVYDVPEDIIQTIEAEASSGRPPKDTPNSGPVSNFGRDAASAMKLKR